MAMPSRLPSAPIYSTAEADMLLRVSFGSRGPGVIPLPVARQFSQQQEALLQQQIDYLSAAVAADERSIMALQASLTAALARITALEAAQFRSEAITGTATSLTFSKPFASPPIVFPRPSWSGQQMIIGTATAVTVNGATCVVKRSRGTLLLTAGPFEDAPAGTSYSMIAIGR